MPAVRAVLAFVLCVSALVLGPAPAQATSMCPDNTLCVWENSFRSGQQVNINDEKRVSNKLTRLMNNKASSVENDTNYAAFLYKKKDARGGRLCLNPNAIQDDLGALSFDDVASSTRVTRRLTCPV